MTFDNFFFFLVKDHGYRAEMEVSLLHIAALYQGAIGSLPQPMGNEKKKNRSRKGRFKFGQCISTLVSFSKNIPNPSLNI